MVSEMAEASVTRNKLKLRTGRDVIDIQPIIMKLRSKEYDMIIGVNDLKRLQITLGNLPFPTPIQGEQITRDREQRAFYPTTEVDPKQWFLMGQRLEELLNENAKLRLSTPCSLENAVVRLRVENYHLEIIG